jgi:hypothetical protein
MGKDSNVRPITRTLTFYVGKLFLLYVDLVYAVLFTNVSVVLIENYMCIPFTAEPSSSRAPNHTPLQ